MMPEYKLYIVGGDDAADVVESFAAADDDDAVWASSFMRTDQRRQLWCDGRLVADWDATSGEEVCHAPQQTCEMPAPRPSV